jgi:hypothetical protein
VRRIHHSSASASAGASASASASTSTGSRHYTPDQPQSLCHSAPWASNVQQFRITINMQMRARIVLDRSNHGAFLADDQAGAVMQVHRLGRLCIGCFLLCSHSFALKRYNSHVKRVKFRVDSARCCRACMFVQRAQQSVDLLDERLAYAARLLAV